VQSGITSTPAAAKSEKEQPPGNRHNQEEELVMSTQEREIEEQGPTFAYIKHKDLIYEDITISYTGRWMPWRRASGLTRNERAKVRRGKRVFINGCPASHGITWREVVYRKGRYRTRILPRTVANEVDAFVRQWRETVEGWRRVEEGVKEWDELTRIRKLMQYGPYLLQHGLPNKESDIDFAVQLAYKWDNKIPGDE
jgi:hypothetical protein